MYNSIDYFLDLFLKIIGLSFINFNIILKFILLLILKLVKLIKLYINGTKDLKRGTYNMCIGWTEETLKKGGEQKTSFCFLFHNKALLTSCEIIIPQKHAIDDLISELVSSLGGRFDLCSIFDFFLDSSLTTDSFIFVEEFIRPLISSYLFF